MTNVARHRQVTLTVKIVGAYLAHNYVSADALPSLIHRVAAALSGSPEGRHKPASVSIEKPTPDQIRMSIKNDGLISFENGRFYQTLTRHLKTRGLTPKAYRAKWGLPDDYPMISANYSKFRSTVAKRHLLGQKGRVTLITPIENQDVDKIPEIQTEFISKLSPDPIESITI